MHKHIAILIFALTAALISPVILADTLKLGALMPMTGALAEYGTSSLNGVKLAVEQINQAGGVLGQPLELIVGDDQTNPQAGIAAAKQLVSAHQVVGLIGALSSGVTIPVASSITGPGSIPQISTASTAPAITTLADNDFLFRTTPHDALQGRVLGDVVKEQGYSTVAVIYVNNDYGKGQAEAFAARFAELGHTVTATVPYEEKQASYRSELVQAAAGGPQVLVLIAYPGDGIPILKQALEEGFFERFVFTDGMKSTDMIKTIGSQYLQNSIGTAPEAPTSAATQQFEQAYQQAYSQLPPLPYISNAYDATFLLALAIQKANTTEGAKIRDALREVANPPGEPILPGEWDKARQLLAAGQDIDYMGAAGNQNFDAAGDVPGTFAVWTVDGETIKTLRIVEPQ